MYYDYDYDNSEFMGKTFQAAQLTHEIFLTIDLPNLTYSNTEVGGSSVWQISQKYFAGVIYGQKYLMC